MKYTIKSAILLSLICLTALCACHHQEVKAASDPAPAPVSVAGVWTLTQNHMVSVDSAGITRIDTMHQFDKGISYTRLTGDGKFAIYDHTKLADSGSYESMAGKITFRSRANPDTPLDMNITQLDDHALVLVWDLRFGTGHMTYTSTYSR